MTLNGTLAETIVSALSTDTQFSDITFVVAYENEIKPTPIEKPIVAISVKQCEIGEKLQETLETGEITAIINEFLSIIEPNEAKIFVRRYFYSEAVGDIAKVYGIKENKVSKILLKTRKTLRTYLAERGIHV